MEKRFVRLTGCCESEVNNMKIAVTSTGPEMDSVVDERFGRARYFLVVDLDTENIQSIDNTTNMEGGNPIARRAKVE